MSDVFEREQECEVGRRQWQETRPETEPRTGELVAVKNLNYCYVPNKIN